MRHRSRRCSQLQQVRNDGVGAQERAASRRVALVPWSPQRTQSVQDVAASRFVVEIPTDTDSVRSGLAGNVEEEEDPAE